MGVFWTTHARERAAERSGLPEGVIESRVWAAWNGKGACYWPANEPGVMLVKVDGPAGRATAVCKEDNEGRGVAILTIRESETAGQGERADEKLTHRPFAAALRKARS